MEVDVWVSKTGEDLAQALSSTAWYRTLLDDNLVAGGDLRDVSGSGLDVCKVRS